jgi:addiction module HigA family antidote
MKTEFTAVHPGEILKEEYCQPLLKSKKYTQNEIAETYLGISRKHFNQILNGHKPVTVDMAIRLSKVFNTTAQFWITLQTNYDLSVVNWGNIKVKSIQ